MILPSYHHILYDPRTEWDDSLQNAQYNSHTKITAARTDLSIHKMKILCNHHHENSINNPVE